ncbi:hypothetical protein BMETH_33831402432314, partial [methanotrophic bacterial endosymbiont of Bathymodiolus sp.]
SRQTAHALEHAHLKAIEKTFNIYVHLTQVGFTH